MEKKLHTILTQLCRHLEALYGNRLSRIVLYGSQARDEAGPDSDIDLLVVLRGTVDLCAEIDRTEYLISKMSLDYNVVIACVFVSQDEFERERSPLLLNIRREGIAV